MIYGSENRERQQTRVVKKRQRVAFFRHFQNGNHPPHLLSKHSVKEDALKNKSLQSISYYCTFNFILST